MSDLSLDLWRHAWALLEFMVEDFTLTHELHVRIRHQVDKWLYFIMKFYPHVPPPIG
jgi:hypothetical protein